MRKNFESNASAETNGQNDLARPERRRSARGVHGEPARAHLIALILGTYAQMPGLSVNVHQAARLFGLREATCQVVPGDLARDGRLRRSVDGQYQAADGGRV